ncbi:MAG: cell division protein FtsL [Gammaproteobacteria bacterium RIFCSPHIGHO2_12_FULL_40_19]|nr:MAG: cell division protein FtsL [Gammaproteobacteria bacterium RIFCSPHIGHO2_12_FULL_40_19]
MNAAARLVHQGVLSRQLVLSQFFNRRQAAITLLVFSVLFSALAVIYVTHVSRILHANYQQNLTEQHQQTVLHGQLLLERSASMMQARVQKMAENKLGMVIPDHQSVVVVHE